LAQTEGCDYVIVQLDTDVCKEYDVIKNKSQEDLFNNIRAKILKTTHCDFEKSKIIPAVCIHSIECWLIPFVSKNKQKCTKVDNCTRKLNHEIRAEDRSIDEANKGKAKNTYDFILSKKKKDSEIQEMARYNVGFSKLIESLSALIDDT
jgi:hypothetical protein